MAAETTAVAAAWRELRAEQMLQQMLQHALPEGSERTITCCCCLDETETNMVLKETDYMVQPQHHVTKCGLDD